MGLTFHPDFPGNPTAFVTYNSDAGPGTTRFSYLSRYTSPDGVSFDPASEEILLVIEQTGGNEHSIGSLLFGPDDGFLYISVGDNGEGGINAQNIEDLAPITWRSRICRSTIRRKRIRARVRRP